MVHSFIQKSIPLGTDTLALESITWSGLNELVQVSPANADSFMGDYSRLVSDIDTLGIANEGDGVQFRRIYELVIDVAAIIYKFSINMAVALAVTAFTSGNHNIDSVQFILTERRIDGSVIGTIASAVIDTGMTVITSAVNQAAIIHFEENTPFLISERTIIRLEIIFNRTDTDVATTFEGIMPLFYFQEGSVAKLLAESAFTIYFTPLLDASFLTSPAGSVGRAEGTVNVGGKAFVTASTGG